MHNNMIRSGTVKPRMVKPRFRMRRASVAVMLALGSIGISDYVYADGAPDVTRQPDIVVTGTLSGMRLFDVPASMNRIDGETVTAGRQGINLSESLAAVPGILVQNRSNYAQDLQVSMRGFGARSSFGIRGLRLYVDGIPGTMPDGQGQLSNIDLLGVDHIEVLRGPFSALYGNSSGGVIQVFSDPGSAPAKVLADYGAGSNGITFSRLGTRGATDTFSYAADVSRFETGGFRPHSGAQRNLANAKFEFNLDHASQLSLVINSVALPKADDAIGLSRSEFNADPRQTDASALKFNTRKSLNQTQVGTIYERELKGGDRLRIMLYSGHRNTIQYQAIPVASETPATSPGGVIDLGRDYSGTDVRWTTKRVYGTQTVAVTAGASYDELQERRRGFLNYVGSGANATLGVEGALRRDEINHVRDFDQYIQASWVPQAAWNLIAGVRNSHVSFDSAEHYIAAATPNTSGNTSFSSLLPSAGITYHLNTWANVYAAAGHGFETPTLNELAYRPNGQTGLNFSLKPARSNNRELGSRLKTDLGNLNVALFVTDTANEIVTQTNLGGRATYQNAGHTRRTGAELAWNKALTETVHAEAAYTHLNAVYRDTFLTCNASPCATPTVTVNAGNHLPGVAGNTLYTGISWTHPQGWRAGTEVRHLSQVYVDDANSDAAPAYTVAAAYVGYAMRLSAWDVEANVRADNLSDRKYAGSVIVNEGNGRFFEPAAGRTWFGGIKAAYRF